MVSLGTYVPRYLFQYVGSGKTLTVLPRIVRPHYYILNQKFGKKISSEKHQLAQIRFFASGIFKFSQRILNPLVETR